MAGATLYHALLTALRVRWVPEAERPRFRARRQHRTCRILCRILGVRVTVRGTLHREAGLIVSNHLGALDPLLLAAQLPVAFVAHLEMSRWPLIGWIGRTAGIIFVDRTRPTRAADFVAAVRRRIRDGVSVLVFPEGTTTHGDRILPFKTGAFEAVAGVDGEAVVPLYLHVDSVDGESTDAARRRITWVGGERTFVGHLWQLAGRRGVHVTIHVGAPLCTDGRDRKELARLSCEQVRALAARSAGEDR